MIFRLVTFFVLTLFCVLTHAKSFHFSESTFEKCNQYAWATGYVEENQVRIFVDTNIIDKEGQEEFWQILKAPYIEVVQRPEGYKWGDFFPKKQLLVFGIGLQARSIESYQTDYYNIAYDIELMTLIKGVSVSCMYIQND